MINMLTGLEMSVPEELVEVYKKAGHKLAAKTAKAEDFAVSPDNGSEPPDNGSKNEKKKQQEK